MQAAAYESLKEMPNGVSVATAVGLVSTVSVVALGISGLAIIGLLLIIPGCGQPI